MERCIRVSPHRRASRWYPLCPLLLIPALVAPNALSAQAGDAFETTVVLQNGEDYRGAQDNSTGPAMQLHVDRQRATSSAYTLRFSGLGDYIRGDDIEVIDARLELYYFDEWWTTNKYHVAAYRSLDGTVDGLADTPEGEAVVLGDKWPNKTKTPRPSWVAIPIRPETVQDWLRDESSNRGIVLCLSSIEMGEEGDRVELQVAEGGRGGWFVGFRSDSGAADERPRLVVRYRVHGNVAPSPPRLDRVGANAALISPALMEWEPSTDPDSEDAVRYQFQVGHAQGDRVVWNADMGETRETRTSWALEEDRSAAYGGGNTPGAKQGLWFRVRAVDQEGATSRWRQVGPFAVAARPWTVWTLDGNRKAWPDLPVPTQPSGSARLEAARNEWESFQVVVAGHEALADLHVESSALTSSDGGSLPAAVVYREHYIPILQTANQQYGHLGMVPDALVPTVHPVTGRPTGGKYGGDRLRVAAGQREAFWLDVFVPSDAAPGLYHGTVLVSAAGLDPVEIAVEVKVWDFALPAQKHLTACFQLDPASVAHSHQLAVRTVTDREQRMRLVEQYEQMLHEHYISNWSPLTGFNYGLNGVEVAVTDGKVEVDWTEYDALIGPYMDGTAFPDGVPAQCLFVPYWLPTPRNNGNGWAARVNQHNYENVRYDLFAQYIAQAEQHLREKGWLDRAYVFYFDEPFISSWKYTAYVNTAKVIREHAPDLRILLTDGYRGEDFYRDKEFISEPIERYVDVWDPVTFQVRNPELAEYYRERKRQGKFDMWCQTLANSNPNRGVINLFPEYDLPFQRMWGVMSWSLGFQGIEWWQTIVWWNNREKRRLDPWTEAEAFPGFRQPVNGDGRLFYSGTPDAIGGADIPIASIRMRGVREAIEDYEYLYLLQESGRLADFDLDRLYTTDGSKSEAMVSAMPMGRDTWQWWEGDPDSIMKARAEMARLIEMGPRR